MKPTQLRRWAIAGVLVGLVGLLAPQTIVQADDAPSFPTTSDGQVYLVDGKTNVDYAAGTSLDWSTPQGAFLSATELTSTPSNYEPARLPAVAGAEQAVTFLSAVGDERDRTKWKAFSDTVNLGGKGVLLPQVTPAYQGNGGGLEDGLASAAVKATGGTYSLGVAYVKDNAQTVVKAYYTTIQVASGSGLWKFATPGPAKTSTSVALTAAPASVNYGGQVTLTATVTPSAATGSVDFFEGTTKLGSGSLAGGAASIKTSALAVGNHTVKAVYNGDSTYATATSSTATVTVIGQAFTTAATPAISGTAKPGNTLTAKVSAWTPTPTTITFQWLLNGKAIAGATTQTVKVKPEWGGAKLTVSVTGAKAGYATQTKVSAPVGVPTSNFTKVGKASIKGTAKVGKVLKANAGSWSPKPAFGYQWLANGKAIKGATGLSLKLTKAQTGKKISVKVTGTKAGYNTKSSTSKPTKKVAK